MAKEENPKIYKGITMVNHTTTLPSQESSPSTTTGHTESRATPVVSEKSPTFDNIAETPQLATQLRLPDRTTLPAATATSSRPSRPNSPNPNRPVIIVTGSPEGHPERTTRSASVPRQARPLVSRRSTRHTSSQPPHRSLSPYSRQPRSRSQEPTSAAMSSAGSSPGNSTGSTTQTSGSSGSNPGYHLPYAPFPYPMPNSGGQSSQGGKGK